MPRQFHNFEDLKMATRYVNLGIARKPLILMSMNEANARTRVVLLVSTTVLKKAWMDSHQDRYSVESFVEHLGIACEPLILNE